MTSGLYSCFVPFLLEFENRICVHYRLGLFFLHKEKQILNMGFASSCYTLCDPEFGKLSADFTKEDSLAQLWDIFCASWQVPGNDIFDWGCWAQLTSKKREKKGPDLPPGVLWGVLSWADKPKKKGSSPPSIGCSGGGELGWQATKKSSLPLWIYKNNGTSILGHLMYYGRGDRV